MLEKKPFVRYNIDSDNDTFTVRITENDKEWFVEAKKLIKQPKNSTALKQLAEIGFRHVLHDEKIKQILDTVLNNSRRNQRTGVTESEYNI